MTTPPTDDLMPAPPPIAEDGEPGEIEASVDAHEAALAEDNETGDDVFVVALKDGTEYRLDYNAWTPAFIRRIRDVLRQHGIFESPLELLRRATARDLDLDVVEGLLVLALGDSTSKPTIPELTYSAMDWGNTGYRRVVADPQT
jgi:hypothetical protein